MGRGLKWKLKTGFKECSWEPAGRARGCQGCEKGAKGVQREEKAVGAGGGSVHWGGGQKQKKDF